MFLLAENGLKPVSSIYIPGASGGFRGGGGCAGVRMFSQNAGNAISETQILKIFRGSMPPDHPRNLAPSALVSPKKTLLDPPLPGARTLVTRSMRKAKSKMAERASNSELNLFTWNDNIQSFGS